MGGQTNHIELNPSFPEPGPNLDSDLREAVVYCYLLQCIVAKGGHIQMTSAPEGGGVYLKSRRRTGGCLNSVLGGWTGSRSWSEKFLRSSRFLSGYAECRSFLGIGTADLLDLDMDLEQFFERFVSKKFRWCRIGKRRI